MDAAPFRAVIDVVRADAEACERLAGRTDDARASMLLGARANRLRRLIDAAETELLNVAAEGDAAVWARRAG